MSNSEIVWNIVKKSSSFLYKNNGIALTNEPFNVFNVNSRKFSGLANQKAVGVSVVDGKVVLNKKRTKMGRYPSKSATSAVLKKGVANGKAKSANAIQNDLANAYYRVDLSAVAVARYNKLSKSLKAGKIGKKAAAGDAMQLSKTD